MGSINSVGGDLPSDDKTYDYRLVSYTLPANSAGQVFELPNSRKAFKIPAGKNLEPVNSSNDNIVYVNKFQLSCVITTDTTDSTSLHIQYSVDGGATFSDLPVDLTAALPGNKQNKLASVISNGDAVIDIVTPLIDDEIIFRTILEDSTDPSTDVLTITNIRTTMRFMLLG